MDSGEGGQYGSTGQTNNVSSKKLQQTHAQVNEVVDIMRDNVEKVIDRDVKLSELDDRADALQQGASQFETQAAKLKRKYWWKNMKMWILLIAVCAVVLAVFFLQSKGGGEPVQGGPWGPPNGFNNQVVENQRPNTISTGQQNNGANNGAGYINVADSNTVPEQLSEAETDNSTVEDADADADADNEDSVSDNDYNSLLQMSDSDRVKRMIDDLDAYKRAFKRDYIYKNFRP